MDPGLLTDGEAIYRLQADDSDLQSSYQSNEAFHFHHTNRRVLMLGLGFSNRRRGPVTTTSCPLSPTTTDPGAFDPLRHLYWHTASKPVRPLGTRE